MNLVKYVNMVNMTPYGCRAEYNIAEQCDWFCKATQYWYTYIQSYRPMYQID